MNSPPNNNGNPERKYGTALRNLMEFYESEEAANEEENEGDLIFQLYDMTNKHEKSDD